MQLSDYSSVVSIDKGWSGDKKYCVTDNNGCKFLLRISPPEQHDRKRFSFEMMQRLIDLGIPMCMPIEFGVCEDGVYLLESWIDGPDAETFIPSVDIEQQYALGVQAGKIQSGIHFLSDRSGHWGEKYRTKAAAKIEAFRACGVSFDGADLMIKFIEDNLHLLDDRPTTLQHGDFHRGNLMIDPDNRVYVIDFDRLDFGDPWEDLKAITWDVQLSPAFAKGRVDGYFQCEVPDEFWRLLALYICVGTISSIPWAIPFGQGEINTMLDLAAEVLDWYVDFSDPVPKWYKIKV